jgi:alpha-N-acetylglucosaminidase
MRLGIGLFLYVLPLVFGIALDLRAQSSVEAGAALIQRVAPGYAGKFKIEHLQAAASQDAFEIDQKDGLIILRGNNGVSISSAFYYYIKEIAGGQITWNGTNLTLPSPLPPVPSKIVRNSPYQLRYYLNYCTFNYSMSWWDWDRWEKEIDWMALHGINMPLAITGQEYVWYELYKELGFTDEELQGFFSGPAYFSWFWMGNLDGWGGPLPKSWMESHRQLQQKILARERALGMKPVLPAFTGHVPKTFSVRFPHAKLKATNWTNGFDDTYILDAEDSLFAIIGKKFIEKQTALYGTDHVYSADTFNENEPPSNDPLYLSALTKKVYEGMRTADADATWVMQGWLFFSHREFWQAPQIKAMLDAVPDEHMIILDLAAEIEPVWKRTEAFYGKPWIWNMLHNFGGNISLFGRMDGVAEGPPLALQDPLSKNMRGIGLTMEGIEQNPVLYELMTDHTWRTEPIAVDDWLRNYSRQRYGADNEHARKAWQILHQTVYNGKAIRDGAESIIVARPTLENAARWARTKLNYDPKDLLPAWHELMQASAACRNSDGFQYDLVDVTRQVLANYALILHQQFVTDYRNHDKKKFDQSSKKFLTLLDDLDALLATRSDFLLGNWLTAAIRCGTTPDEKALYERNARDLITLWGGENDTRLHEYACRQWSGLISGFYKPRWAQYFTTLQKSLDQGIPVDQPAFDAVCRHWEWNWVNAHEPYSTQAQGNPVGKAQEIYTQYKKVITNSYSSN